ncbi:MAG: OmpP1/FadL family transporter [Thiogranum sp.]
MNSTHKYNATVSVKRQTAAWLGLLALLTVTAPANGAGLWLYEQGMPDLGTAAAGRAALAESAATAGGNPAGMTRLKQSQLLLGAQPMYVDAKFDTESSSFGGGNAGGWVPAGGLHYVHSVSDDLKLGLSAASYLGLGLDYGKDWAGRYYITEGEILTFAVQPSVGYRVNEQLSIGGGINIVYGSLDQKVAVNNVFEALPDGQLELDEDDVGYGFNLSTLYEFNTGSRIGLAYQSRVDLEFDDVVSANGLGPLLRAALTASGLLGSSVDMEMTLPQQIMLSGYHQVDDKLAIVANLGWQDWSEFGKTDISVNSSTTTSLTVDRNFDDTWHMAIGARYRVSPPWLLMAGFAYDSSPVDNDDRTIDLPLDRQYRYALGAQYQYSKDLTLGSAFEILDAGDAKVNQTGGPLKGDLKGEFDTNTIYIFNVTASWRF